MSRTVPYTPMLRLYNEVCKVSDKARLARAKELVENPQSLVDDFLETVQVLEASYDNIEAMRDSTPAPRHRDRSTGPAEGWPIIAEGDDVAYWLKEQRVLTVEGAPELNVEYADFELYVMRTTGKAKFDMIRDGETEPRSAGGALKVDLVMANTEDRVPTAAEVKVGDDKEPFSALIQALTYLAHMVSPRQYKRLRDQLSKASFPNTRHGRGDAYVLLYRFGEKFDRTQKQWVNCPATYHAALADTAAKLAVGLEDDARLGEYVRRLVCLDLTIGESNYLTAEVRWRTDVGSR